MSNNSNPLSSQIPSLGNNSEEILKSALSLDLAGFILKFKVVGEGEFVFNSLNNSFERLTWSGRLPLSEKQYGLFDSWLLSQIRLGTPAKSLSCPLACPVALRNQGIACLFRMNRGPSNPTTSESLRLSASRPWRNLKIGAMMGSASRFWGSGLNRTVGILMAVPLGCLLWEWFKRIRQKNSEFLLLNSY